MAATASSVTVEIGRLNYRLYEATESSSPYASVAGLGTSFSGTELVIPAQVEHEGTTYPVVEVASDAFTGNKTLTYVKIPFGVKNLGRFSFGNCSNLNSVEMPNSLEGIGHHAFYGCRSLTAVKIPNSVTTIEYSAFDYCSLNALSIPSSVTTIGNQAFASNYELKEVTIPATVTSMGRYVFAECGLESVVFAPGVKRTGEGTFVGCDKLVSVTMPEGMESIDDEAFGITSLGLNCASLKTVKIPSTVTNIGAGAFKKSGLASVNIPSSVTDIGDNVFSGCTGLVSVTVPSTVTNVGNGLFADCRNLSEVFWWSGGDVGDRTLEGADSWWQPVLHTFNAVKAMPDVTIYRYRLAIEPDIYDGQAHEVFIETGNSPYQLDIVNPPAPVNAGNYDVEGLKFWIYKKDGGEDGKLVTMAYPLSYTIKKAQLTASVPSATIVYGERQPEHVIAYSGFVNGEDTGVLSELPVVECGAGELPNAGTYELKVSGGESQNYEIVKENGTLTVEKAPLEATADSYVITYGESRPELGVTYSGFVNGDEAGDLTQQPLLECGATDIPDAGSYPIRISSGVSGNYSLTYVDGLLTVEKASQTIGWEEDFTEGLPVEAEVELPLLTSASLPICYESSNEQVAVVGERDGAFVLRCVGEGDVVVFAWQPGDSNHHPAKPVSKTIRVFSESSVQDVAEDGIVCYPVPARNHITIAGAETGARICLYDVNGNCVREAVCESGKATFDIGEMPSGVYFIRVVSDGSVSTRRFVKQ